MQQLAVRSITCAALLSLVGGPLLALPANRPAPKKELGAVTYKELGDSYMRSQGIFDEPEEVAAPIPLSKQKVMLDVPQLDHHEKMLRLFEYLGTNEAESAGNVQLMDQGMRSAVKDLDIFFGQGEDYAKHVFGKVNRATTVFGEAELAMMIAHPLLNPRDRQAAVKELNNNIQLRAKLQKSVDDVRPHESAIFSFCAEENKPTKQQIGRLYFGSSKNLNTNVAALEASTRAGNMLTAAMMAMPVIVPIGIACAFLRGVSSSAANGDPRAQAILQELHNNDLDAYTSFSWSIMKQYLDPRTFINDTQHGPNNFKFGFGLGTKWGLITYGGLQALPLYITKVGYDRGTQLNAVLIYLQSRLMGMAALVNSLKEIDAVLQKNPTLAQGLVHRSKITSLFDKNSDHSAEFKQLIELLQTDTFKGDASFFSSAGRILAANTLMTKVFGELMGAFEAFGEVDALLSIVKLYQEFQGKRVKYTFVEFVDRATPYLKLQDFWNPLVDPNVVVPNSIELGGADKARDVVLTGANTGGKSTILKAMMIDAMFAQALTIAAASSAVMTPFAYFGTSLNKADDTAAGYSLYQAEVNVAQAMMRTASMLQGRAFAFMVIDELFRGTSPEQAEQGSYECAQRLISFPNVMFILATHFTKQTTKLEKETGGVCKNYKVEIYKDAAGNLVKPYKLEPGINSTHVASDILHSAIGSY